MSATPRSLDEAVDEVTRRTGLRTHVGRRDQLRRVLEDHIETDGPDGPGLMDALIDAAAIDESYFFRHGEQLSYLRSHVLPRLLSERPEGHALRIWSAGCADGEEPYTVAVILHEEGLADRAEVLATDVSAGALVRARGATYTPWSLRSAEVAARSHLFEQVGGRQRLASAVTDRVRFRQHNLLDPRYPQPEGAAGFDVILCRNVLVHLEREAVATVIPRLAAALAPGGWLLTAPADPPALGAAGAELLEPVVLPGGGLVYRRVDGAPGRREQPPAAPARRPEPRPAPHARRRSDRPATPPGRAPADTVRAGELDGRSRCLEARRLLGEGRPGEAFREAQAAAFLESELPAAHLTLALAANAADRRAVAGRAFRRAAELLDDLPTDEPVELCDGETAGRLADLARAHALLAQEGGS